MHSPLPKASRHDSMTQTRISGVIPLYLDKPFLLRIFYPPIIPTDKEKIERKVHRVYKKRLDADKSICLKCGEHPRYITEYGIRCTFCKECHFKREKERYRKRKGE